MYYRIVNKKDLHDEKKGRLIILTKKFVLILIEIGKLQDTSTVLFDSLTLSSKSKTKNFPSCQNSVLYKT